MTDDQLRQWIANQIANAKADRANIWKGLTVHGPQGDLIRIEPLPSLMDDPQMSGAWMTHPPSPTAVPPPPMTEKQVDEMIAYVVQAWPRGALAKLYRILYADGMRIDSAKLE